MKPTDFLGEKVIYDPFYENIKSSKGKIITSIEFPILENRDTALQISDGEKLVMDLGQWIADAINEKLERERR